MDGRQLDAAGTHDLLVGVHEECSLPQIRKEKAIADFVDQCECAMMRAMMKMMMLVM